MNKVSKETTFEGGGNSVLDYVPQMMWEMDDNAQFIYGNILWRDYIGNCYSPITDPSVVHPDDYDRVLSYWKEIKEKDLRFIEIERRLHNQETSTYQWFLTRANRIVGKRGDVVWIGTCTNINDMKNLQNQLARSNEWWKIIANVVPVMVWVADANGDITYYNDRWFKFVGEGNTEWTPLVHPDDIEQVTRVWLDAVQRKTSFYHQIFRLWNVETAMYRWVETQGVQVNSFVDSGTTWIGATIDIHELNEAIENKRRTEYVFNLISDNLPVIIYATDKSGKVIMVVGKSFQRISQKFGLAVGDNLYETLAIHAPQDIDVVKSVIEQGKEYNFRRDVFERVLQVTLMPTRSTVDGSITGLLGISFDITEEQKSLRERAELALSEQVARESNRIKTQFLANMSHELRTPLNGILGMSELLLQTTLTDEQRDFVSNITSNVTYLTSLVNDIIDISRIESGKLDIQVMPFDIKTVLKEVVDNFMVSAIDKGIKLSHRVSFYNIDGNGEGEGVIIVSDPVRIRQILWNLVSNAVKFTVRGHVHVEIRLFKDADTHKLQLVVKDTGIGMSQEVQENLFKPFTQGEASNTRRFGGTGLGLFITKLIVDKMEGTINVQSQEDIGTTMSIAIPVQVRNVDDMSWTQEEIKDVLSGTSLQGKHVLVAEDNVVNQIIVRRTLEKYGVLVSVASNGRDAVDFFRKHESDIDLILMDIQMPIMDGFQALHLIKDEGSDVPVVAMTASAMKEDIDRSYKEGMTDHISKPFRSEELVRTVVKNIRGRGLLGEK